MGLTAFNSKFSRSNIPQDKVPRVPASYRALERDVEGGKINHSYEVWTLGCLYLEMFTWLIGGKKGLEDFQDSRCEEFPNKNGMRSGDFFAILEMEGAIADNQAQISPVGQTTGTKKQYIAQVKEEVKLDSKGNKILRKSSSELEEKFEGLYRKCMDDNHPEYCTRGITRTRHRGTIAGVKVTITKDTEEEIAQNKLSVRTYEPGPDRKINSSLSPQELSELDRTSEMDNLTVRN